jgi:hypothetical protein
MQATHDATRLAINAGIGESPADIYDYLRLASHKNAGELCEIFGGDARAKSDLALAIAACDAAMPNCIRNVSFQSAKSISLNHTTTPSAAQQT